MENEKPQYESTEARITREAEENDKRYEREKPYKHILNPFDREIDDLTRISDELMMEKSTDGMRLKAYNGDTWIKRLIEALNSLYEAGENSDDQVLKQLIKERHDSVLKKYGNRLIDGP